MNDKTNVWVAVLGGGIGIGIAVIIFVPLLIYSVFVSGFVISSLWAWFVVPLFDVPALTLLQAAGLGLLVMYMSNPPKWDKKLSCEEQDTKHTVAQLAGVLLQPWFTLLVGYIIHVFIG